jgi:outer membrane protein assembly factor BamB
VTSLVDKRVPGLSGRPLVVGNLLLVIDVSGLHVFDAATCPNPGQGACTPLWERVRVKQAASDGTSIFVADPAEGLIALDLNGNQLWEFPKFLDPVMGDNVGRVATSDGYALFSTTHSGHGFLGETLYVLPASGCGQAQCAAVRTFSPGHDDGKTWAVDQGRLFLVSGGTPVENVIAFDLATGAELWRSATASSFQNMVARDGSLYVFGSSPQGIQVYDGSGAGCTGTPTTCAPKRTLVAPDVGYIAAVTSERVVALDIFHSVATFFRTDDFGCTGVPLTCGPVAKTKSFTNPGTDAGSLAVANNVVYVSSGKRLLAYDLTAGRSCTGASPVCPPLMTKPFANDVSAPIIWGGKIYFSTSVALHALSLPG